MKKVTVIAGVLSLALVSAPAQASNGDVCDYQLDYDLTVNNSAITFSQESGKKIAIDQDNHLFVDGSKKTLDGHQQKLIDDYADGIRDLIPQVTEIAIEGVNLGVQAASMALGTLLGEGDADFERFNLKINELGDSITNKLSTENFDSKKLEEAFDDEFEEQIEAVVEEAVTELTPRLMAKIVAAAMSGNEDGISDLEARAESIEYEIENFIEPKAEALEARAEELCGSIDTLNKLEDKMVVSGLEMMDLIEKDESHQTSTKKRFKFNLSD